MAEHKQYDVVVVGAGHNGLTTAAYLARAGAKVLVVERRHETGGAERLVEVHLEGVQEDWNFQSGTAYFTFQFSVADPSTPWIREAPGLFLGVNTYLGR